MAQVQEKHLNRTAEALDNYERALTLEWVSPYSRIAAISLAAAQTRAGNPRKAATILDHAIRRSPDEAELHQSMAATLFLAGDFKEALAHARIAERLGFPMSEAAQAAIRRAAGGDEKASIR
jgi:tetratricopeptide (TPR) repeat protein